MHYKNHFFTLFFTLSAFTPLLGSGRKNEEDGVEITFLRGRKTQDLFSGVTLPVVSDPQLVKSLKSPEKLKKQLYKQLVLPNDKNDLQLACEVLCHHGVSHVAKYSFKRIEHIRPKDQIAKFKSSDLKKNVEMICKNIIDIEQKYVREALKGGKFYQICSNNKEEKLLEIHPTFKYKITKSKRKNTSIKLQDVGAGVVLGLVVIVVIKVGLGNFLVNFAARLLGKDLSSAPTEDDAYIGENSFEVELDL